MIMNGILADIVMVIHTALVIFMLWGPFSNRTYIYILHITFSVSLLVHWFGNNNMCALSLIESQLRGTDYKNSFTHSIIAPVYDISKSSWSNLCYIVTFTLMFFSIYKLRKSETFNMVYKKCSELESKSVKDYLACMLPLLEVN